MAQSDEGIRQVPCALAGPSKWGLGIPSGRGIDQGLQVGEQSIIPLDESLPSTTRASDTRTVGRVVRVGSGGTILGDAHPDRVQGQARGLGDGADPTPAQGLSLTGRPTAAQPLIHDRGQGPILLSHSSCRFGSGHCRILNRTAQFYQVILEHLQFAGLLLVMMGWPMGVEAGPCGPSHGPGPGATMA